MSMPKQVKVDNWGIFFLQRLEHLFEKEDLCDLTLRFSTQVEIKVHSLVLNACTEYFHALEKQGSVKDGCLDMPSDLLPEVVIPIIKFMYTGRLELVEGLQSELYAAAQQLHMSVLTKLLDAQRQAPRKVASPQKGLVKKPLAYNLQGKKISPKVASPFPRKDKDDGHWPELLPGRKLPIWKRRSVPKTPPQSTTSILGLPTQSETLWAEGKRQVKGDEPPRPTRFDWPEAEQEDFEPDSLPFADMTYESQLLPKSKIVSTNSSNKNNDNRAEAFEELRKNVSIKRTLSEVNNEEAKKRKLVDINAVRELVEEQRMRKAMLVDENADVLQESDIVDDDSYEDHVGMDDDEDEDVEHHSMELETDATGQDTVLVSLPLEKSVSSTDQPPEGESTSSPAKDGNIPQQKSILRPQRQNSKEVENGAAEVPVSSESVDSTSHSSSQPQKKVRFLLNNKETMNSPKSVTLGEEIPMKSIKDLVIDEERPNTSAEPTEIRTKMPVSSVGIDTQLNNVSNHAKIISEVLKKYPQLVKDNKNIRLKIMQRGSGGLSVVSGDVSETGDSKVVTKSKVSYVVLKSGDRAHGSQKAVVVRKGSTTEPLSEIVNTEVPKPSGAENVTGPWLCYTCGTSPEEPVNFESYYVYRKHLQEVHQEKIDSRICEHCGHRASKRNLLLYHLYTKHDVPPPRNCQFPKCDKCDYIALTESLLIKHRNNHLNARDYVCKVCNASFKSNGALQGHVQANLHTGPERKVYECVYCSRTFARNINLKAHLRSVHKDVVKKEDEGGSGTSPTVPSEEAKGRRKAVPRSRGRPRKPKTKEDGGVPEDTVILVPHDHGTSLQLEEVEPKIEEHHVELPQLDPSSEAEALSHVVSGIATSLGLSTDSLTEATTVEGVIVSSACHGYPAGVTLVTDGTQQYIIPDMDDPESVQAFAAMQPLATIDNFGSSTVRVHDPSMPTQDGEAVTVVTTAALTDVNLLPVSSVGVQYTVVQSVDIGQTTLMEVSTEEEMNTVEVYATAEESVETAAETEKAEEVAEIVTEKTESEV